MTAVPAHPAIRLPIGRLAPIVVGVAGLSAAVLIGLFAVIRPAELATALVGGGSVVLGVGAMYAALAAVRVRHILSLTTIFMGLSMVRLVVSAGLGAAYMLTAQTSAGDRPDKFVFAVAFLGVSLAVIAVETVLVRRAVRDLAAELGGGLGSGVGGTGMGTGGTRAARRGTSEGTV